MLRPDLVARIYQAALHPDAFDRFLALTREALDVDSTGLFLMVNGLFAGMTVTSDLLETLPAYYDYYKDIDPWAWGKLGPLDTVYLSTTLIADDAYLRTEFHNDYGRFLGMRRALGVNLGLEPNVTLTISSNRDSKSDLLGPDEEPLMAELGFHIKAAAQLHRSYLAQSLDIVSRSLALDALDFGALVCTGSGRVLHANREALRLGQERAGITLEARNGTVVRATTPAETERLERLIAEAGRGAPGAMRLAGRDGRVLAVLATPLSADDAAVAMAGLVLLSLRTLDGAELGDTRRLRQLFGLSEAQAVLCAQLASGLTFEAAAAERGVALATARAHFRAILERTGTRNLRDLLRLLASVPPVRT